MPWVSETEGKFRAKHMDDVSVGVFTEGHTPRLHPAAAQQCKIQMWDKRIRDIQLQNAAP